MSGRLENMLLRGLKTLVRLVLAYIFAYVFVYSGLVVSVLCLLLLVIWPFSKSAYRWITSGLAYTVLGQLVWICVDYSDLRIHLFGNKDVYERFGNESMILTSSHRGDLDWVAGFVLGARFRFLHSIRSLPKWSVQLVPGFGQLLWALEYPFLARNNYQKDKETIARITKAYKTYPFPIQVAIYCEGTRFTKEKHERGVEYAKQHNLPPLKHHLVPRTKGFALLAEHLREGADFKAIYDVGVAYPNKFSSHMDMLLGKRVDLYWYMRRFPIEELPATHEGLNTFCYQMFQHKDEAYEHLLEEGEFPAPRQPLPTFDRVLWRLRFIMATWALLMTVLPTFLLYLFLPWQTMCLLISASFSFNTLVFVALVIYGRGKNRPEKGKAD